MDSGNNHDAVSTNLLQHVAPAAIFDSYERYCAEKCYPRTRESTIERIEEWIRETNPDRSILWMYGPTGAGKSSVMQSICELLETSDPEKNGASFFFSRGGPDCGQVTKLFTTLAFQLAMRFPSLRTEINNALCRDATLPTKSMDIQLQSLIIDPLLRCKGFSSPTPVIFIDGLDECGVNHAQGVDTQSQIIALISKSLVEQKVPIRFMIASRPEYWIRDSFETTPLSEITLRLSLRDDFDTDQDIRKYLTENFEKIRLKNIQIMRSVVSPWPSERIIDRFVYEASGQYSYASTVLKFVGDLPFTNPEKQLQIIINPILSTDPRWDKMKRVLRGLLLKSALPAIQALFGGPRTEITSIHDAIRSLIDVVLPAALPEDERPVIPHLNSSVLNQFVPDDPGSALYNFDFLTTRTGDMNSPTTLDNDERDVISPAVTADPEMLASRLQLADIRGSPPLLDPAVCPAALVNQAVTQTDDRVDASTLPNVEMGTSQSPPVSNPSSKSVGVTAQDLTEFITKDNEYAAHGGGYADIYEGALRMNGRTTKVAIKVLRAHAYAPTNQWKITKRLNREIRVWSALSHPNIVPLLGVTQKFGPYLAMVCPWMNEGDLNHYLDNSRAELKLEKRLQILVDVVLGLTYLHQKSIIHGDLTSANVLMNGGKAQLTDFGLSNVLVEIRNTPFLTSTVGGSPRWTAPELIVLGDEAANGRTPNLTKQCDIYSFGSLALQVISGKIPYSNIGSEFQVLTEIIKGSSPPRPSEPLLSDAFWSLIVSCLGRDPITRPDINQVGETLQKLRYSCSEEELASNIMDFPDGTTYEIEDEEDEEDMEK